MCLYTPQALQTPKKKSASKGSSSYGNKKSSQGGSTNRGRSNLPRGIIINQPMPVPPPQALYQNLPSVGIVGEGESTNIYLPTPVPPTNGQQGGQNQNNQGNNQNRHTNERRRSSMLVQEVDRAVAIAKRLGEAVRRGSASSFGRSKEYERRRDRERDVQRLWQLEEEREREIGRLRGLEELERGRAKDRESSRQRRIDKYRREKRTQQRTPSSSRSRSRERRSKARTVSEVRGPREFKVVDEEARMMANYAQNLAGSLIRDNDIKKEAKKLLIEQEKKEELLADRVLSGYGAGGLLTPPPPLPRGRFKDWDADRDRGRDWREGVSWAPWNAQSYSANYVLGPPPPSVPPTAQVYGNNSGGNENGNGNSNNSNGGGRNGGNSRSRSQERRHLGSNHIHIHTAPLVQGPQISTTAPGAAGDHGAMPCMAASSQSAGGRRSSFADSVRNLAHLLEQGLNYSAGGRMNTGYGMSAIPQLHSQTMGGSVPIYGMNGFAQPHMPAQTMPVPAGEREWQRARVYNATTHDPGMGGMMY